MPRCARHAAVFVYERSHVNSSIRAARDARATGKARSSVICRAARAAVPFDKMSTVLMRV